MSSAVPLSRHGQLYLLANLYIAQGLPFGFFTLALPLLLREAGWSLTQLSLLQLLAVPWALKFLWAPYVDHHGSRRSWLLILQALTISVALVLALIPLQVGSPLLFGAVLGFNILAATQDIVTDGLAVRLLNSQDRGLANALQVGGYRLGMMLGEGVLLWIFARTNWQFTFLCMAILLAVTTIPVQRLAPQLGAAHVVAPPNTPPKVKLAFAWLERLLTPGMLSMGGLLLCYRLGDQMVSSLLNPFMLDQGLSKADIALMKGLVGSGSSLFGAVVGGAFMLKFKRRQALLITGLGQVAVFGLYIALALYPGHQQFFWITTICEGIVSSMASVALFSLMMDASDPAHAGTDYTLLASIVIVISGLGSFLGGWLGDHLGYATTFIVGTTLTALGCLLLVKWLDWHPPHERIAQAWQ